MTAPPGAFIDDFVPTGTAGIAGSEVMTYGPDGHLYMCDGPKNRVLQFNAQSGALERRFVNNGAGGLLNDHALTWGPDDQLYVSAFGGNSVLRFNRTNGNFVDTFVAAGDGGLSNAHNLEFGPDGNLYVTSFGSNEVLRYDGSDGTFIDAFVPAGAGGIAAPICLLFLPHPNFAAFGPSPGTPGVLNTWTIQQANPGETLFHVIGLTNVVISVPGCPGVSLHAFPLLIFPTTADANGETSFGFNIPPGSSGVTLFVQSIGPESCRNSNLLRHTFP